MKLSTRNDSAVIGSVAVYISLQAPPDRRRWLTGALGRDETYAHMNCGVSRDTAGIISKLPNVQWVITTKLQVKRFKSIQAEHLSLFVWNVFCLAQDHALIVRHQSTLCCRYAVGAKVERVS